MDIESSTELARLDSEESEEGLLDDFDTEFPLLFAHKTKTSKKMNLHQDTHGSFVFAFARWWDAESIEELGVWSLCIMTCYLSFQHFLVLGLQFYICALMYIFVIERREDPFEGNLALKDSILRDAIATNTPLNVTDPLSPAAMALKICWKDHSVQWSLSPLLFIWFVKISIDIKDAINYTRISFRLPTTTDGEILLRNENSPEVLITSLTPCLRCVFLVFANIPRVIICVILALVGAKFLEFASSLSVLILKSVGLTFIADLRVAFYKSLTPPAFQQQLKNASFCYPKPRGSGKTHSLCSCLTSTIQIALCAALAMWFCRYIFWDVADFRKLCNQYEDHFHYIPIYKTMWVQQNCTYCGYDLFGFKFLPEW